MRKSKRQTIDDNFYSVISPLRLATLFRIYSEQSETPKQSTFLQITPYQTAEHRLIQARIVQLEKMIMPGKYQKKTNTQFDTEFINYRLNVEEVKQFEAWYKGLDNDFDEWIAAYLLQGIKVSTSWDEKNQTVIGTFTCKDESSINYNKSMSSRSNSTMEALAMCAFKADIIFKGKEWVGSTNDQRG